MYPSIITPTPSPLLLRHALLLQLNAAYPAAIPVETLHQGLHVAGHALERSSLIRELNYLKEKSFLEVAPALLSPSESRYKLTASGSDYLQSQSLT